MQKAHSHLKKFLQLLPLATALYHFWKIEGNGAQPHGRPFTIDNGKVVAH